MNFDWKNIDLKNACIFDLTDDIELIRDVVCDEYLTLKSRDSYLEFWPKDRIACHMQVFAHEINDKKLFERLENLFHDVYERHRSLIKE